MKIQFLLDTFGAKPKFGFGQLEHLKYSYFNEVIPQQYKIDILHNLEINIAFTFSE